jgi:transmembrane 9 superfamily member 3
VPLESGKSVEFTYSVRWVPTPTPFHRRFERYLDFNFFEHKVCAACLLCPLPAA